MTQPPELTPPVIDFLNKLNQNQTNFLQGVFPEDGWITRDANGNGYVVRLWDKFGPTVEHCSTQADVIVRLNRAAIEVVSGYKVARQVSHDFHQRFFEAVESRRPHNLTEAEAKLCGAAKKINEAMVLYSDSFAERKSSQEALNKFRGLTLSIDRLIVRANELYSKL